MKSFLAVLAGLVVTIVLSTCVDFLVVYTGIFPATSADNTDLHWAIITGYRAVIAEFGPHWYAIAVALTRCPAPGSVAS